ncbi:MULTISPECIES: hypothetical protein [unclassified Methylobacterium]|uniref:hypothetical protein n=1 Tax=unclassified Methylobacterium TaxID=2615210 RepID=UPI002269B124|nr:MULTISPECIES: hypothetical protein [unclassified Methylobacterium]
MAWRQSVPPWRPDSRWQRLAPSTAPAGVVECGDRLGLPELPLTRIMLHARPLRGPAADALRALAAAYRGSGGR